jgi:hypothetical protein
MRAATIKLAGKLQHETFYDTIYENLLTKEQLIIKHILFTIEKPNQPAVGVSNLLVNGVAVISNGELIKNSAPGQPIRRDNIK